MGRTTQSTGKMSLTNTLIFLVIVSAIGWTAADDCRATPVGLQYTGRINVTSSGRTCQRWDVNSPHRASTCARDMPDAEVSDAQNYCRNPDYSTCKKAMPWCYTTDSKTAWEYCYIPECGYVAPAQCSNALGMENGDIKDEQITASSKRTDDSEGFRARLNNDMAGWLGAWVASSNDQYAYQPYVQVDLLTVHRITRLYLQGAGNAINAYTKTFALYTSTDGLSWQALTEQDSTEPKRFHGNEGRYHTIPHVFDPPLEAAKVTVMPLEWYYYASLRLELFGCPLEGLPPYPTPVPTDISRDTTWELNFSPYVITGPITVRYAATLTIQPGVKVFFTQPAAKLLVEGCLKASGLKGLEVHFLSDNVLVTRNVFHGDNLWGGIEFGSNACGKLQHVVIAAADQGITVLTEGITLDNVLLRLCNKGITMNYQGDLEVTNSVFEDVKDGIYGSLENSKLFVSNSRFYGTRSGSSLRGIYLLASSNTQVKVEDCQFSGLQSPAILSNGNKQSTYLVRRTTFQNAHSGIYINSAYVHPQNMLAVEVDSCTFEALSANGFYHHNHYSYAQTGQVNLTNSIFKNCQTAAYIYSRNHPTTPSVLFRNVTVQDNGNLAFQVEVSSSPITVEDCTFLRNRLRVLKLSSIGPITVQGNTFLNNGRDGIISVDRAAIPEGDAPVTEILMNTFVNNTVGTNAVIFYKDVDHRSSLQCQRNVFRNPGSSYDISAGTAWKSGYLLDATENDWGSADPDFIVGRVFDFFQNMDIAEMLLNPARFKEDAVIISRTFTLEQGGFIGGRIEEDIEFNYDNVVISVFRTIHIPPGITVVITGGATFNYQQFTGILVEGTLQMGGSKEFSCKAADTEWSGIRFIRSPDSFLRNGAIVGTTTGIRVEAASFTMRSVTIDTSKYEGINVLLDNNETLLLENCTIQNTQRIGVNVRAANPTDKSSECAVDMHLGVIRNSNSYGMFVQVVGLQLNLYDVAMENNRYDDLKVQFEDGVMAVSELKCQRKRSSYSCIDLYLSNPTNKDENIHHVSIHNSTLLSGGYASRGLNLRGRYIWSTSTITVENNTFAYDTVYGMDIDLHGYYAKAPRITLLGNRFNGGSQYAANIKIYQPDFILIEGNTFYGGTQGLYLYPYGSGLNDGVKLQNNMFMNFQSDKNMIHILAYQHTSTALVQHNSFINNTVNSVIYIERTSSVAVMDNVFENPASMYDLRTSSAQKEGEIVYARRNWWGSSKFGDIGQRIHDQNDDPALVLVDFEPYRTIRDGGSFSTEVRSFIRDGGEIGGAISENTVLQQKDSPYTAVENIHVPFGFSLTIEAGTTIHFQDGGITVQGRLLSEGTLDEPVVLLPKENGQRWKGISFEQPFSEHVRLAEGEADNDGLVEFFMENQWYSICDQGYDKDMIADIVCKQMGFVDGAEKFYIQDLAVDENLATDSPSDATTNLERRYANCYNSVPNVQQCSIGTCWSRQDKLVGVSCIANDFGQSKGSLTFITSKAMVGAQISFNSEFEGILSANDGKMFHLLSPGLSGAAGSVSFESSDKPGWYLRHYNSDIFLEPKSNPRNSQLFETDATFTVSETTNDEYVAFESSIEGHYVTTDELGKLHITEGVLSNKDFLELASFKYDTGENTRRRKRAASLLPDAGEITSMVQHTQVHSSIYGILMKGLPPVLDGVLVNDTTGDAISYADFVPGAHLVIRNSEIRSSQKTGIRINPQTGSYDFNVQVENSVVAGCVLGLYHGGPHDLTVTSSTFSANTEGMLFQQASSTVIIADSVMTGHPGYLIQRNGRGLFSFVRNNIKNNIVTRTSHAFQLNYHNSQGDMSSLINNTFAGNQLNYPHYYQACLVYFSSSQLNVQIRGNTFEDNLLDKAIIGLDGQSTGQGFVIEKNTMINNRARSARYEVAAIWVYNSYNLKLRVESNTLVNPDIPFELQVSAYRDSSSVVEASKNFWNRTKYWEVLNRIDCFYNNMELSLVNVWPIRVTESMDNPVYTDVNSEEDFFTSDVGGDVHNTITLSAAEEPYVVDRSILVRMNATLTIEPGTTLHFKPKRGIRVIGNLKMQGTLSQLITMSRLPDTTDTWYGISMDTGDTEESQDVVSFTNFKVEYCTRGMVLRQYAYNITGAHFRDAGTGINFEGQSPLVIKDSTFIGGSQGVYVTSTSEVTVEGCSFSSNPQGLTIFRATALYVATCQYQGNTRHGLQISLDSNMDIVRVTGSTFTQVQTSFTANIGYGCDLLIARNNFTSAAMPNSNEVLFLALTQSGEFRIEDNEFVDLSSRAVVISPQHYQSDGHCYIRGNIFRRVAKPPLLLNSPGDVKYTVESNVFSENDVSVAPGVAAIEIADVKIEGLVRIALNDFENNQGDSLIYIGDSRSTSYTTSPMFVMEANVFLRNTMGKSLIQTKQANCRIHYNIFSSAQSPFDLRVEFTGEQMINATMNWWGTTDLEEIGQRVFDQADDSSLGVVILEPFLEEPEFSCDTVASCSGHGDCVRPDVCQCDEGWKGPECNDHSCSDVHECSNRGQCVAPNVCDCDSGWLQPDCVRASCQEVNECSSRGICVGPNECRCAVQYKGDACETCQPGHWGELCRQCPRCVNGDCHPDTGVCVCDSANWSGDLCQMCSDKYYGSECLPLIKVLRVAPKRGPDVGGTTVYVQGHNFPNSDEYTCLFGTEEVDGTWMSDEEIRCVSPAQSEGTVEVEIKTSADESFTSDKVTYTYYAVCPESACGSTKSPPRGVCSMGRCLCINPWTGEDCDILGVKPSIAVIPPQSAVEGGTFQLELKVSEGTLPIEFTLISRPTGMILEVLNGIITWEYVKASATPYQVVIGAKNRYGSSQVAVSLQVPISYMATLDEVPLGPFQQASQMLISGKINFLEPNSPLEGTSVPVNIIIHSAIGPRIIRTTTRPGTNIFYERFNPSSRENGLFEVDARHPEDSAFEAIYQWSVYGLSLTTAQYYWSDYLGEHIYPGAISVKNTGVDPLTNLQISAVNLPFELMYGKVNGTDSRCSPQTETCPMASVLLPGATATMDAFVDVQVPVRGGFTLRVFTDEGPSRQISFSFDYKEKKPKLVLEPTSLSLSLIRGRSYTAQVNVTNRGLRPATNVRVELPELPMLSVISLGMAGSDSDDNLVLDPEETAVLSLGITPVPDESLGAITGGLVVRALETAESLSYRFTIVSSDKLDLVVRIEDEFTYFAEDKPLLEGATVQLRSQFGGGSYTLTTDETGMVTFEDIREDYYNLYCSAPRHVGDSRVIFATGSDADIRVFLERTAVTYSWVVTPVTFEDEYEITLEADFETFVPMPVVTIKPQELDLEVLQRGLQPVIDFELTNHGLIAAQNVNFRLPARGVHPFMYFEMDIEEIGDLPANTTFYLPVRVIIMDDMKQAYLDEFGHTLTKRNPLACLALAIYAGFSYICDRERFQQLAVPLRNAMSKNCGGGGGSGGGGGGSSHWSGVSEYSIGPNTNRKDISITKPLTCDEVINCLITAWYCFNSVVKGVKCVRTPVSVDINLMTGKVKFVLTCYSFYKNVKKCRKYYKKCSGSGGSSSGGRRRRQAILSQNDIAPELAERLLAATDYFEEAEIIVGDESWLETDSADWVELALTPTMADNSDGGSIITSQEYARIWEYPLPTNVNRSMAEHFVKRMNNTIHSWDNGILEGDGIVSYSALSTIQDRIKTNEKKAGEAGYESLSDWYEDGYQTFENAKEISEEGVCAKVRIQIKQRLVLTRSAFSARLELENGEEHELTYIGVEIIIVNTETKELATEMFAFGNPDVDGISNVDGTGTLGIRKEGSAEWLIIPYGTAAPEEATEYDIGGNLFYTVGEDSIVVPLFPDTVTVQPDPRLYLNYFLEKFVQSDDALTEDIIEPTVPFSLGILVSNEGFGTATNLHITSGQPEIIENEKGLLIKFAIIGAQLGIEPVSPSLRITFGDIAPHTTEMARWLMTSSLKGVFSNYSATFENTNPLGDPELSVMESVLFHQLLHVVMADAPEGSDDGIPDFLTIDETRLDISPGAVYLSHDGINPLDVTFGNITRVDTISSAHFQIITTPSSPGWNYFRTEFDSDITLTPQDASRSDGRRINIDYNLWINTIDDVTYLHMFDYFGSIGSDYSYGVTFLQANDHKPEFATPDYYANVTEAQLVDNNVITLEATDADDQTIKYMLAEEGIPFSVDADTGSITLTQELDREEIDTYTLTVLAVDNGTPPRTGTAAVQVIVKDINDNDPFLRVPSDVIRVEEIIETNHVLFTVSATDLDAGPNGEVVLTMDVDSGFFEFVASTGIVRVKESPEGSPGSYTVQFSATDQGSPSRKTTVTVTIEVVPVNENAPSFDEDTYMFKLVENNDLKQAIGQVKATDEDVNDEIRYSIQAIDKPVVEFSINPTSGDILTSVVFDYEEQTEFTFNVLAVDDGVAPTGSKSGFCTVKVVIEDENDNKPVISLPPQPVMVSEDTAKDMFILSVQAEDADSGENGMINSYSLSGLDSETFTIGETDGKIYLAKGLDREEQPEYTLTLAVEDSGEPPQTAIQTLRIKVTDVNDNPPEFNEESLTISIQKSTPVNSEVVKVEAFDADEAANAEVVYTMVSGSREFFTLNQDTGSLRLIKDLNDASASTFDFEILASDGVYEDQLELHLEVVEKNLHSPSFLQEEYEVEVSELADAGTTLDVHLEASDEDSIQLSFSISSGNEDNMFSLAPFTGELTLLGELDFETEPQLILTVVVSDGGIDGEDVLTGSATVVINVLNENEASPVFVDGPVYQVSVFENKEEVILTLQATDADMDSVRYNIPSHSSNEAFSINAETGALSSGLLDRETQAAYLIIVAAVDSGEPSRTSTADVYVTVDDVNDNAPVFPQTEYNITVLLDSLGDDRVFFTIVATDADEVESPPTYRLTQGADDGFVIDANEGMLSVTERVRSGTYTVIILATDGGGLSSSVHVNVNVIGSAVTAKPPITTTKKTGGAGHQLYSVYLIVATFLLNILKHSL